jgi:hypothetical protein
VARHRLDPRQRGFDPVQRSLGFAPNHMLKVT